ncbi:MAG TPA: hypothetical protein GYA07_10100 [Verrucomicrobia bacterium]|nr:hypothetical protein [Verrucomicrobiota bacterium]HOB33671.1 hypothetical protein [Verrucomicrobiota bacterium]
MKFQSGWRCFGGIQWAAMPPSVADDETRLRFQLLAKAGAAEGITQAEDPALKDLAERIAEFIRQRDAASFESKATPGLEDVVWMVGHGAHGQATPPRSEIEKQWTVLRDQLTSETRTMLSAMEAVGMDLKESDIAVKSASIGLLSGSSEQLIGSDTTFVLE